LIINSNITITFSRELEADGWYDTDALEQHFSSLKKLADLIINLLQNNDLSQFTLNTISIIDV
jgi:hypothetical protein